MTRSPEIEQLVRRWFTAATNGDDSLIDVHVSLSDDTRLIGSDAQEHISGGVKVADFLRGEVRGAGGSVRFEPADIEAFEHGETGWATTRLTISMPDGRHVSPRWSSVFVKENGVWKFVQTHASIGVPNDQIGWVYDA